MRTGILEQDSPALYGRLKRLLGNEEVAEAVNAYKIAADNGALNDYGIERPEGMNFNPRPARVAQILASHGEKPASEKIIIAILSCIPPDRRGGREHGSTDQADQDIRERSIAVGLAVSEGAPKLPASLRDADVLLSHFIDMVRHLHMRGHSPEELLAGLAPFEDCLAGLQQAEGCAELRTVLSAAISRLRRNLPAHD